MTRPRTAWWARRVAGGIPVFVLVVGLAIMAGASVLVVRANQDHQESLQASDTSLLTIPTIAPAAPAATTTTAAPAPATDAASTTAEPTTAAPATVAPATTEPPTTQPATTAPATTTAATTEPATTAAVVEDTTVAPTTPPSMRPSDGRVVAITSRVGACSFGPRCLIAGFKLTGFPKAPTTFVCEFADGSRTTFRVGITEVKQACSTSKVPDSITIEVDGVRSETVTTG